MLSAIVLAAGNSSRMGSPKALLEYVGRSFIENVCGALRSAGVAERVVVLGRDAGIITSVWRASGEKVVLNSNPDLGQLSSLRVGIAATGPASEGFMICLADQPTIRGETYKLIADFWRDNKDRMVIPRCRRESGAWLAERGTGLGPRASGLGPASRATSPEPRIYKRGHPIIIPAIYRDLCFEGPLDKGLHWVTHHPSVKIADLTVEDAGIIRDFDTPEEYEKLKYES
jgi:CTP:molybdopterin cytidylyltransferase MocA